MFAFGTPFPPKLLIVYLYELQIRLAYSFAIFNSKNRYSASISILDCDIQLQKSIFNSKNRYSESTSLLDCNSRNRLEYSFVIFNSKNRYLDFFPDVKILLCKSGQMTEMKNKGEKVKYSSCQAIKGGWDGWRAVD